MPMSVTEIRGLILANALVAFPHIVHQNNQTFPSIPPRAQDIFEISISLSHEYGEPDYVAILTHRHGLAPALHVLLLDSAPKPTPERALLALLDTTCTMLGTDQAKIIERPPGAGGAQLPVLRGSLEGDRIGEMGRAKACVTHLKEVVRSQMEAEARNRPG